MPPSGIAFVDEADNNLFHFFMKSIFVLAFLLGFISFIHAQPSQTAYVSSVSTVDRIALVRSSVELTEWHEKAFWVQYNDYLSRTQELSTQLHTSMQELASVIRESDTADAAHRAGLMLDFAHQDLKLITQSYGDISRDHNGVIALQFLQAEIQLALMEGFIVYENTTLRKFRLNPGYAATAPNGDARYNVLAKALNLTTEESEHFHPIYTRYQAECDDALGTNYSMYELFAGPASDYSPGLAKRIGYDLLTVARREMELKKKFYQQIESAAGPVLAARFLAWEDYYSLVCKITVWSEAK
jgi:hypothetical protein